MGASRGSVSVIIGAYNAAAWIDDALHSVLAQTHPLLEVLVVDDGSTDDTANIVRSYGGIVRLLEREHRGWPHRNHGIRASTGDFLAFIDADDVWDPRKIELQIDLLRSRNLAWAVAEVKWLDEEGRFVAAMGTDIQEGDVLRPLFLDNFITTSTVVAARHVVDEAGYFREAADALAVEDWDLWLRIAARHPLGCVRQPLATLRLHKGSFLDARPTAESVISREGVISRALIREPVRLKPLENRARANIHYAMGVRLFRQGLVHQARGYFVSAWRYRRVSAEMLAYIVLSLLGPGIAHVVVGIKRRLWSLVGRQAG